MSIGGAVVEVRSSSGHTTCCIFLFRKGDVTLASASSDLHSHLFIKAGSYKRVWKNHIKNTTNTMHASSLLVMGSIWL